MQTKLNRKVSLDDGVALATDVYMPDGPGPWPVVFIRTPYHRSLDDPPYPTGMQGRANHFVDHGYACVVQDCRGKGDSDDVFRPFFDEPGDGHASLDWIANQSWCNGRIGMWGRSYVGMVQVPAASGGHDALKCLAPSTASTSMFHEWMRQNGVFALAPALGWAIATTTTRTERADKHYEKNELFGLPGPAAIFERIGFDVPTLLEWAAHDRYDDYWQACDQRRMYPDVKVPALHVGGWFDHMSQGQPLAYKGLRDSGGSRAARQGQRLLMGPWWHLNTDDVPEEQTSFGDWRFGADGSFSTFAHETRFLGLHLKDIDDGLAGEPPVRVFLLGDNRWLDLDDWPPPDVERQAWHLSSGGGADRRGNEGHLGRAAPDGAGSDSFAYDPRDPVPSLGGAIFWGIQAPRGWLDQRPVLARDDVLVYRGEPLADRLTLLGDIGLDLTVASDAEDTDFIARLCVEDATGHTAAIAVGNMRCRYRESWSDPRPLDPDRPVSLHLDLGAMAYTYAAGSRVVLAVMSSDYPRLLPGANTMAGPWAEENPVTARNTVLHGGATPSTLTLPVARL